MNLHHINIKAPAALMEIEYSSDHVTQLGMTQRFLKSPSATGIEVNASMRRPETRLLQQGLIPIDDEAMIV